MSKTPLVSIIIPTYNRAHLIGETLDSVLAQTYQNWECLVVDDGSTDATAALLAQYIAKDSRFKYYQRPKKNLPGGNGARNYGFEVSEGEYVQWLDSDDLISENKITSQVNRIVYGCKYILITSKWAKYKNSLNVKIKNEELFYRDYKNPLHLLQDLGNGEGLFPPHAYLVERIIVERSGLWNENLRINQDGEFFSRVIINCENVFFTKEAIAYQRVHTGDNISVIDSFEKAEQRILTWKMINNHLINKFGVGDFSYVKRAKISCYKKIRKKYPFLILKYCFFLKNEIYHDILKRMVAKLKLIK